MIINYVPALHNFSMKQVYRNIKKCCISLYRRGNQYIFVHLQIKYLSKGGQNLDEIGDFGRTKNDILDNIFLVSLVTFVCLYLCSVWPAKRLGRSRPNLTHALMSTQGLFLSRSMSRSFTYACGSDSITKHPARCAKATPGERCSNYVRRTGEATPGERLCLRNSVRMTCNYSSSNEARRRRRRAASAKGASRTPSGGRVITASRNINNKQASFITAAPCAVLAL